MTEQASRTAPTKGRNLTLLQQISYAIGNFGVAYGPATFAFLAYFYYGRETPSGKAVVLVPIASYSVIWFLCNALNGITDPVVGYLSDHTRSRWGRRKPWVVAGAPFLAAAYFFLWAPVTETPSVANAAILCAALFFFWLFFTVVVAPYLSLLPEITPYDDERVKLSAMMSGFGDVGGNLLGSLLPLFAGLAAGGFLFLPDGYRAVAFVGALVITVFSILSVSLVKESYVPPAVTGAPESKVVRRALREFCSTFKNRAFPPYLVGVFFYRMAIMITLTMTPFIATKILGAYPATEADLRVLSVLPGVAGDGGVDWEKVAGYLMMLVLLGSLCLFALVSWLAGRTGKRLLFVVALVWFGVIMIVMSAIGLLDFWTPFYQAVLLFALAAVPVAIALVVQRPMLADVIDADEDLTGLRREGVYNGMEGLIMKVAAGMGPLLAGVIFELFGSTVAKNLGVRVCGPVSGVCLLLAAVAYSRYPIKK